MPELYNRYLQGYHQDVYNELLAIQEKVFDDATFEDALLVAREIMRRVRYNITLLLPRLEKVGYQFGKGFWDELDNLSPEEKASIEKDIPVYHPPTLDTPLKIAKLERLVGPIPLSLKCWYEEVGSVNLIGTFSSSNIQNFGNGYGYGLDPLFMYSIDMAIKMTTTYIDNAVWANDPKLPLAPDGDFKYARSGIGTYAIQFPCKAFDALLLGEKHHTTFINYIRICCEWGGFPGVEENKYLTDDEIFFLKEGFLAF